MNVHRRFLTNFFLMLRIFLKEIVLAFGMTLDSRASETVGLLVQLLDVRTLVRPIRSGWRAISGYLPSSRFRLCW